MSRDETIMELEPATTDGISRQRILVIDDDLDQVESLAFGLRRQGFDVQTAHSVGAAIVAIELHTPDLIIMDIHLPDGDGLTLCQDLSDNPNTCDIPVIVLSGLERLDIVRRARAAGCQFFLHKPYDPNALLLLARSSIGG